MSKKAYSPQTFAVIDARYLIEEIQDRFSDYLTARGAKILESARCHILFYEYELTRKMK